MGINWNWDSRAHPARVFCFFLTLLVVVGAIFAPPGVASGILPPVYFGIMIIFFLFMGLLEKGIRGQGYRFLLIGMFLLFSGNLGATLVQNGVFNLGDEERLFSVLKHGIGSLLGFSTLSFGFLLWLPDLVRKRHNLNVNLQQAEADRDRVREKLGNSEKALDRANNHLFQAERLAMVGELAAGIAHDLRNPLAIIRSAAQASLQGQRSATETRRTLEVIKRSVDKADRTIKGLLEMGRPISFTPACLEADFLVEEVLALVGVEAGKAGVTLEQAAPSGALITGDADLLSQVFLNLCLNAIQASPPDSIVRVGARPFRTRETRVVGFFVEDGGPGIPTEIRNQVFEPFFSTREEGCGLGLTMCQRMIQRHGGKLAIFPRTRGGTRALFLLSAEVEEKVGVEA